jgi:hypothetical protein
LIFPVREEQVELSPALLLWKSNCLLWKKLLAEKLNSEELDIFSKRA